MQLRLFIVLLLLLWSMQSVSAQSPAWLHTSQKDYISSADISSDGSVIATGSTMGTLAVFNKVGEMQWSTTVQGALLVDVSPDGSVIVSGSRESMENDKGTVRAYDRNGKAVWLNNTGWIAGLTTAGDPLMVAVGTRHGMAEVYDAKGNLVKTYSTYPLLDVVKEIGISSDGKSIAFSTFSRNPVFKLANISKGSVSSPDCFGDHIALSANGSAIAVADGEGSLGDLQCYAGNGTRLWSLDTGDVNDLAISQDGTCVVTGQEDGTITCYNRTGTVSWTFSAGGPVTSLSITPNATLVAAGSMDEHVYLLDGTGKLIWEYGDAEVLDNPVSTVRLSESGNALIAVIKEKELLYFPIEKPAGAEAGETGTPVQGNSSVNLTQAEGNIPANATPVNGNTSGNSTPVTSGQNLVKGNSSSVREASKNSSGNVTSGKEAARSNIFASFRYPGSGTLPWADAWQHFILAFARG